MNIRTLSRLNISDMCADQFYTLIPVEEIKSLEDLKNALWVRGDFDKRIGKYKCYKYFDYDFAVYRRGNCKGYAVNFTRNNVSTIFY